MKIKLCFDDALVPFSRVLKKIRARELRNAVVTFVNRGDGEDVFYTVEAEVSDQTIQKALDLDAVDEPR